MKVYVLAEVSHSDFDTHGVFSSLEDAKAKVTGDWKQMDDAWPRWVNQGHQGDWWIHEHELTDGPQ